MDHRSLDTRPGRCRRPATSRVRVTLMAAVALALPTACGDDAVPPGAAGSVPAPDETAATSTIREPTVTEPVDAGPRTPDPSTLPEAPAPAGLGDIALPGDDSDVMAVFEALPYELLGGQLVVAAAPPGRIVASFDAGDRQCGQVAIQAFDLTTATDFSPPSWRAEHVITLFAGGADWDVEDAGRDGDRYWVTFETYCGGEGMSEDELVSSAGWGDAGSPWVFFVAAADGAGRDTLLDAFVAAATQALG